MPRKPVTRVDSGSTHGYFARVYRDDWVGSKSFADGKYGGRTRSVKAAWDWWEQAEKRLPTIPPKPVQRQATIYEREETRRADLYYFDVYTPPDEDQDAWSTKFYFGPNSEMDREEAEKEAFQLRNERNEQLHNQYNIAMVEWRKERDKIMQQILEMWPAVKELVQPPEKVTENA